MNAPRHSPEPNDISRFLTLLWEEGDVREIRIPRHNKYGNTASGYFDSVEAAVDCARAWDGRASLYITLNEIDRSLFARAVNRIEPRAVATTADGDVTRRTRLLIDIDPTRASGISSTDAELAAAAQLHGELTGFLTGEGWPEPIACMSGNGYYALYGVDLANDAEATALVRRVLETLAERFNTAAAHVDTSVFNAARLVALIGTTKTKGDSTPERPHRRSHIVSAPETLAIVTRAQLEQLVERSGQSAASEPTLVVVPRSRSLADTLRAASIGYREQPPDAKRVTWYHLHRCPFHEDGRDFECGVGQMLPDGPYTGHCFHPEGQGRGWQDFKRALGLDGGGNELCDGAWDVPIPLVNAEALLPFPVDVFPLWLRQFVEAEALATQTPPDLASMIVLSALGCAAAKMAVVEVRAGWREPLNIWTVTALDPGNRKSAVFSDVTRPILAFENGEARRLARDIAEARVRQAIASRELTRAQDAAAKTKDIHEHEGFALTAIDLQQKIDALTLPVAPRLIADDATPEKLTALMAEHGGRLAVLSAEAEIFEQMSGKYQSGTQSFNVFLKGHSGDDLRVDRIGRAPDYVQAPALTLGLTVQPSVIQGLSERPGFRGRGLLARICYSLPTSTVGRRDVNPPPMEVAVRESYATHLTRVLELQQDGEEPHVLSMTAEAHAAINEMAAVLEPTLAPHAQFGFMADWAAKLSGTVVRIAGLLHVADCAAEGREPWSRPLERDAADRARDLATYLLTHAMAAIRTMGADAATSDAEYLLGWLRQGRVTSFSARDAQRHGQSRFRRIADLEAPLQLLVGHGYIRARVSAGHTNGRPASTTYEVNPSVFPESA